MNQESSNEQDNLDMIRLASGQDAALTYLMVGRGDIRHFGSDAGSGDLLFSDEQGCCRPAVLRGEVLIFNELKCFLRK